MKITKYGQCCLLIEVNGKRILTDPGRFTSTQNDVTGVDIILITHEHADHLHIESLDAVTKNNPGAKIITNTEVGKILKEKKISHEVLEGRSSSEIEGIMLEAYDGKHAKIDGEFGLVQNTGYFIAEELFYPGDAYTEPGKEVSLLALPAGGPWFKSADALAYARAVKPKRAFPVHDWMFNKDGLAAVYGMFENRLRESGITFIRLTNGETKEF